MWKVEGGKYYHLEAALWLVKGNNWQIRTKTQAKCHLQLRCVSDCKGQGVRKSGCFQEKKACLFWKQGYKDHKIVNAGMSASWVTLLSHIIFSQAHPFATYPRDAPIGALYSISKMDIWIVKKVVKKCLLGTRLNKAKSTKLLFLFQRSSQASHNTNPQNSQLHP